MRIVDVADAATQLGARLESTLRARKAEIVSRHLDREKKGSKAPSRPSQENLTVVDGGAADPTPAPRKKWNTKLVHPTYQLVGEECPNCDFPEADGGYCPECGWSKPHPFKK